MRAHEAGRASLLPLLFRSVPLSSVQLPRCMKWLKESCTDVFDEMNCSAAWAFCQDELMSPYTSANRNFYDITKQCERTEEDSSCYGKSMSCVSLACGRSLALTHNSHFVRYLSLNSTQEELGVDPAARGQHPCHPLAARGSLT